MDHHARTVWCSLVLLACLTGTFGQRAFPGAIRMNQIQVLHAHNTYHACPLANLRALYTSPAGSLIAQGLTALAGSPTQWNYGHAPVDQYVQQYGVRSFEFDIYYDPTGGRYKYRAAPKLAKALGAGDNTGQVGGPDLDTPGWKVAHILDWDPQATCDSLLACMKPIADYSKANPLHTPFFIVLEARNLNVSALLNPQQAGFLNNLLNGSPDPPTSLAATPAPDPTHFQALQAEILSLFDRSQLFSPGQFRAGAASNQDRIKQYGWPLLDDVRGKTFFRLLAPDNFVTAYKTAYPPGTDGLLFIEYTYSADNAKNPDIVFASADFSLLSSFPNISDPTATAAQQTAVDSYRSTVEGIVSQGTVMLRLTVDEPINEAVANFPGFSAAGIAGGAHFVHTDYPNGWTSTCVFNSTYTVKLAQARARTWQARSSSAQTVSRPGGVLASTCNPATALKSCSTWATDVALPPPWCTCFNAI